MIIIYSNEDYKASVLKYCLLIKEMSFLTVKKRKSQRLNVSSIEELHSSSLYDNQKTIEEINETQDKMYDDKDNIEPIGEGFENQPLEINIDFNDDNLENGKNDFNYSIDEFKEEMVNIEESRLPSLTKIRKKAEYVFNYTKNNPVSLYDNQPLIIEDLLISLQYINDKLELPNLFPIDLPKKHMFFHVLKDINKEIILPFIEIENQLKKYLGLDAFVRMTNKSLSKKLIKKIYSDLNIFDKFNIQLKRLMELLNVRINKKHLLYNYISIIDILILPLFFRLELIKYFDFYKYDNYEELFIKIRKLYNETYCKKACFNKCNGQIVH